MAENIPMIALSPTMEIGTITKWNIKEGDSVSSGDVICEVETDKATMEYESSEDGVILKILIPEGGKAAVGIPIAIIGEDGEDLTELVTESKVDSPVLEKMEKSETSEIVNGTDNESVVSAPGVESSTGPIKASPLARKIALDEGIDINTIHGSGPEGRVIKRDIESVLKQGKFGATTTTADVKKGFSPKPVEAKKEIAPQQIVPAKDKITPVQHKRSIIAKRLAESKFSAPHYYMKASVKMDSIVNARQVFNQTNPVKISMNAIIMKIVAEALKKNSMVNASWQNDTIIQYGRVDIGLAVAQEDGLITPVVRNIEEKSILKINEELKDLIEKAKNNRLKPEEYTEATFTISNMGSYGVEEFTAIINPPGSAILAVGSIQKQPVVDENGRIIVQQIAKFNLSCDHRVIDGAVAAGFMKDLKNLMETPLLLFMEK